LFSRRALAPPHESYASSEVVMLQLRENPPAVSPGAADLERAEGSWWVAHTRSRCEKVLAWDLLRRGISYYLPMVERVRMSGGRKRRVLHPLFPGYLFFCGDADARLFAMTTKWLHQTLEVPDERQLVRELTWIKTAIDGQKDLVLYGIPLMGSRCRVLAGPLRGLEGIVVARNGKTRIVLEVSMLGQGVVLEVENHLLELIDTPPKSPHVQHTHISHVPRPAAPAAAAYAWQ
jgi:hypothetical protein